MIGEGGGGNKKKKKNHQRQQSIPNHSDTHYRMYDAPTQALLSGAIAGIVREADEASLMIVGPTSATRKAIMEVVRKYLRDRGRKICGGMAINQHLLAKGRAPIYDPTSLNIPDLDAYSPEPVADAVAICNLLFAAGFSAETREALHFETYTIIADTWKCCDISYVHRAAYNKIPMMTSPVDGMNYVAPSYMYIDFLRILTDPIASYWRLEKSFPRFTAMFSAFPLEAPKRRMSVGSAVLQAFGAVPRAAAIEFLRGRDSVIVTGLTAYQFFMDHDRTGATSLFSSRRKDDSILEVTSVDNYERDASSLHECLKRHVSPDVRYEEFQPFCDFWGRRGAFSLPGDGAVIARIYDVRHKAVPFLSLPLVEDDPEGPRIQLATFASVVLLAMILRFRVRVENNQTERDARLVHMYDNVIADMYGTRRAYLKRRGASILDDTPYKEFVIPTIGEALNSFKLRKILYESKTRRFNQKGLKFIASANSGSFDTSFYTFANTSGNAIQRPADYLYVPPGTVVVEGDSARKTSSSNSNSTRNSSNSNTNTNSATKKTRSTKQAASTSSPTSSSSSSASPTIPPQEKI